MLDLASTATVADVKAAIEARQGKDSSAAAAAAAATWSTVFARQPHAMLPYPLLQLTVHAYLPPPPCPQASPLRSSG